MNHAFLLTGSNAAGKTTAVEKAIGPWKDDPRIMNIRADNDGRFKGEADDQRRVLEEMWLGDIPILMIEGTRINTPLMYVAKKYRDTTAYHLPEEERTPEIPPRRQLTVLMALQTPEVMKAHLIARCAKKNKTFRSEYWTYKKLEYEGMKRYPNSFAKNNIKALTYRMDTDYMAQAQIVEYLQSRFREILG